MNRIRTIATIAFVSSLAIGLLAEDAVTPSDAVMRNLKKFEGHWLSAPGKATYLISEEETAGSHELKSDDRGVINGTCEFQIGKAVMEDGKFSVPIVIKLTKSHEIDQSREDRSERQSSFKSNSSVSVYNFSVVVPGDCTLISGDKDRKYYVKTKSTNNQGVEKNKEDTLEEQSFKSTVPTVKILNDGLQISVGWDYVGINWGGDRFSLIFDPEQNCILGSKSAAKSGVDEAIRARRETEEIVKRKNQESEYRFIKFSKIKNL